MTRAEFIKARVAMGFTAKQAELSWSDMIEAVARKSIADSRARKYAKKNSPNSRN